MLNGKVLSLFAEQQLLILRLLTDLSMSIAAGRNLRLSAILAHTISNTARPSSITANSWYL
ncbi:hypothetical protein METHB2_690013 [Candidatus Methylobacter favarea]|uniref:Uncharacterized protein n=1 Tax=Candidatus Methylobacter favarea TaxID=2707345 RepID=A0A8S0XI99_9GAMM|nr:hypothetical protein METHB2_690013 [Candidatus Methylobacter favarea]